MAAFRADDGSLSTVRLAVGAVVLLVLLVVGAYLLGVLGAPSVTSVENRFGPVNDSTTIVETDLVVNNPNPIGVRLGGTTINYTVRMNDVRMANGVKDGVNITTGNTTLAFETAMDNGRIPPWWVTHVRNDERTTVVIDARVRSSLLGRTFPFTQTRTVETDIIGQFNSTETRPVNASRPLVSDPVLYINETKARWGNVTDERTPIDMEMVVYNPKTPPYTVTEVGYNITMNDVHLGSGRSERPYLIEGGTTETLELTTVLRNQRLDEWWVTHLENDQVTQLRIDFYARVELPGGQTVRVPLEELTYERTIETDIFGNKDADDSGGGNGGADGEPGDADGERDGTGGTATPTDGDTTPASTPTATPTDDGLLSTSTSTGDGTPTPTPTPTDDGLLSTPTATPTDDGLL